MKSIRPKHRDTGRSASNASSNGSTRAQLVQSLLKEERAVVIQSRKRALVQRIMTSREKWLAHVGMISLIVFIVVLITVIFSIVMIMVQVSHRYSELIAVINQRGPRTKSGIAIYPTVLPFASPGFNLAFACQYPAFTQLLGYVNKGLPYACYISVYSSSIRPSFMKAPTKNLAVMYNYAQIGQNDTAAGNTTASLAIVCKSWGFQSGLTQCEDPCPPNNNPKWYDYVSSSLSFASTGAMLGSMVFPPVGLIFGTLLGAAAGATITALKSKTEQKAKNCIAN